jgi:hypothetical protein
MNKLLHAPVLLAGRCKEKPKLNPAQVLGVRYAAQALTPLPRAVFSPTISESGLNKPRLPYTSPGTVQILLELPLYQNLCGDPQHRQDGSQILCRWELQDVREGPASNASNDYPEERHTCSTSR